MVERNRRHLLGQSLLVLIVTPWNSWDAPTRASAAALTVPNPAVAPRPPTIAPSPINGNAEVAVDTDARKEVRAGKRVSGSPFIRWPEAVVEADGDYRNEAHLEKIVGGPLYSKQGDLPSLPVPSLVETIDRFIPTALPLAESADEARGLLDACAKFPQEASSLQSRLLRRREEMGGDTSWLAQLWCTQGYLRVRDPIAVLVSYFLHVPDDPTLPSSTISSTSKGASTVNRGDDDGDASTRGDDDSWRTCVQRAAAILVAMAESRERVCTGSMPCETIDGDNGNSEPEVHPLCSSGFKYMFHSCRIPRRITGGEEEGDVYRLYDPSLHRHCAVAVGGHFFALDFVDDDGKALPLSELEDRLWQCVHESQNLEEDEASHPKLGWLTSCPRDYWAESREDLLQVGGETMDEALTKLESAAFVLNLDHKEPETPSETDAIFWHGTASCGGNRWFDKPIQIICTKNGHVAYQGEHSMVDAAPAVSICSQIMKTRYKKLKAREMKQAQDVPQDSDSGGVANIFRPCWSSTRVTALASCLTERAKDHHAELTGHYDLRTLLFDEYGKKFIKRAGMSPDAFLQMAMQLASYRLFGKQVGTYEAAQTRAFLHGRTETTRSVSPESQAFVKRMGLHATKNEDPSSQSEKLSLLRLATNVHSEYHQHAEGGLGVDRHFFGLSSMLEGDEAGPGLFSDPVYQRSKRWRLSTSLVAYSPGFGPVVDDGIGVGYGADANSCIFTCTSRQDNDYVGRFCDLLEEALLEMGQLVEAN